MLQGGLAPPFAPLRGLGAGLVLLRFACLRFEGRARCPRCARRRARPSPLSMRFASKDPPARLCRVSLDVLKIPRYLLVGVLYLFCGCIE